MSTLVTLVRHGRTTHNTARRIQGELPVELDELGRWQAACLARRLADETPRPDRLIASDMLRAQQTAGILGAALGLPVETARELREVSFTEWQGRTYEEVEASDPLGWTAWRSGDEHAGPGGGESLSQVAERMHRYYRRVTEEAAGQHVVLVTHGAALSALLARLFGWGLREAWVEGRAAHDNTAITQLAGELEVRVLACAKHLTSARS